LNLRIVCPCGCEREIDVVREVKEQLTEDERYQLIVQTDEQVAAWNFTMRLKRYFDHQHARLLEADYKDRLAKRLVGPLGGETHGDD
jgi:hypothetical protein